MGYVWLEVLAIKELARVLPFCFEYYYVPVVPQKSVLSSFQLFTLEKETAIKEHSVLLTGYSLHVLFSLCDFGPVFRAPHRLNAQTWDFLRIPGHLFSGA